MTTTDTMDTEGSVEQSIRMIEAGSELVRLTAPSKNEAQNLEHIKKELNSRGYQTPLVADIHFTPNAAEIASRIVEKVRVNPGNYADKKKFEEIEYTDESYQAELERIEKNSHHSYCFARRRNNHANWNKPRFIIRQNIKPLWRHPRRHGGVCHGIYSNL